MSNSVFVAELTRAKRVFGREGGIGKRGSLRAGGRVDLGAIRSLVPPPRASPHGTPLRHEIDSRETQRFRPRFAEYVGFQTARWAGAWSVARAGGGLHSSSSLGHITTPRITKMNPTPQTKVEKRNPATMRTTPMPRRAPRVLELAILPFLWIPSSTFWDSTASAGFAAEDGLRISKLATGDASGFAACGTRPGRGVLPCYVARIDPQVGP